MPIDGTLHGTLGLIAYNKQDYMKSIQEYEAAIKDNMKDDASHFYLAYDYLALMAQASKAYQTAFKAETDAHRRKSGSAHDRRSESAYGQLDRRIEETSGQGD